MVKAILLWKNITIEGLLPIRHRVTATRLAPLLHPISEVMAMVPGRPPLPLSPSTALTITPGELTSASDKTRPSILLSKDNLTSHKI
jgi:hypothetical protein